MRRATVPLAGPRPDPEGLAPDQCARTPDGDCTGMTSDPALLTRDGLDALLATLHAEGFRVLGPTVQDGAIVYDDVARVADLPVGWTDRQDGGSYRLERRGDDAVFGHTVGPYAWKRFLHPPLLRLWRAESGADGVRIATDPPPAQPMALVGVHACELRAIAVQDAVFLHGAIVDPHYAARRQGLFVVAVNCGQAGGTCFCTSMQAGPKASAGYDLALTELAGGFLVETGTTRGAMLLDRLPHRPATAAEREGAAAIVARTATAMRRHIPDPAALPELLLGNLDHPRWDEVAARCLSCGNCTQVCPTCFCTDVTDTTDLTGATDRTRRWDSCFAVGFSYIHGGAVRPSPRSRYRQWMTHKLASWVEQFGTSGCTGCGRCITWCPVGIDITEEVAAIRDAPAAPTAAAP